MPNDPRSLNIAPEKYRTMMLGRWSFPFGKVTFQGWTVKNFRWVIFFVDAQWNDQRQLVYCCPWTFFSQCWCPIQTQWSLMTRWKYGLEVWSKSACSALQRISYVSWGPKPPVGFFGGIQVWGHGFGSIFRSWMDILPEDFFWSWDRKGWC